jgi:cytidylate kinase
MSSRKPIVAIDGPSGAGKSTVSRRVAQELGFTYIDTGAMYRCIGFAALRDGLSCENSPALDKTLDTIEIAFDGPATKQQVFLNGENVSEQIRVHEVSKAASDFSALPVVREKLVALQRNMGQVGGVVMEGRDIGTNVFPDAEVKIYLDASAKVRAKRRYDELRAKGESIGFEKILEDQEKRDEQDMNRPLNPLCKAVDAEVVETSEMTIDEVVTNICKIVNKKQ